MQDDTRPKPLAHSPEKAAARLGISTRRVYQKIATGELRSYKDGKRRLIPDSECQRLVAHGLAQAAEAHAPQPTPPTKRRAPLPVKPPAKQKRSPKRSPKRVPKVQATAVAA